MTDTRTILLLHGVQSSQLTWWRLKQDLQDLGWQVHTVDLLGHGSRNTAGPSDLTVEELARDVLAQLPGPVDVLAGHSLGSVVGLTVAQLAPDYCARLVIEDPPAISRTPMEHDVVGNLAATISATRADPAGTLQALLEDNPLWSYRDAENSIENRLNLDLDRTVRFLRTTRWDIEDLVERCPVPVPAAGRDPGLDADRTGPVCPNESAARRAGCHYRQRPRDPSRAARALAPPRAAIRRGDLTERSGG